MGKLLRVTLSAVLIILVLIIGIAIILPLILDPNDFKPEIEAAAYRYTGKKLVLEGDLELSIFPWLGVSTGKLFVFNPSSVDQQPLAAVDESHLKVKLLPLLIKKIELNRIVLKNPVIHLIKDQQGNKNWQNNESSITSNQLPATAKSQPSNQATDPINDTKKAEQVSSFLDDFEIGGVSLENGTIIWIDRQKDRQTELRQLNLDVETLAFDQPAEIDLSMQIKRQENIPERVTANTQLVFNKAFDHFKLTDLEIKLLSEKPQENESIVAVARSENVELDWQKQELNLSGLSVASGGMFLTANLSGNKIKDQPEVEGSITIAEFNPREFYLNLGKSFPALQNQSSLTRMSGSFALSANKNSAQLSNIQAKIDDSTITGHCVISNYKQPAYEFNFNLDTINLDQYIISKSTSSETKKALTLKTPKSPVVVSKKESPPVKTSASTVPKVTRKDQKSAAEATVFPIELLRKLNASGQFSVSKMITNGLTLQDFVIKLDTKDGVLNTSHNIGKFYQGRYSGSLFLDVKQPSPSMVINEKFTNIQVEPLLKDLKGKSRLTGTITGNTRLTSQGNTIQSIKARLNGNARVSLRKGVIYGFNLREMVKKGKALIKNKKYSPEKKYTDYSKITADAKIKNGVVKSKNLYAEAESLKVKGSGTANLNNEQLDYIIVADLVKRKKIATEPDQIKRSLGIDIAGKFEQPTYTIDLKTLVTEKEKQKLYDKAEKKLGKGVSDILKQLLQ